MRRIGIDVGGTNTDAVAIDGERVLAAVKTPTTQDVTTGIVNALADLMKSLDDNDNNFNAVMIGTTHFTNAVVARRGVTKVAAVRIGLPASASLPPFVDWPEDLAQLVRGPVECIHGGHEYDGRRIVPFDARGMREAALRIRDSGVTSVGICAVFSPLTAECEEEAAEILRDVCPDVDITLSHKLGRIGLLERENATLLNACLVELAGRTTEAFLEAMRRSDINAPLYLTQNDGTVARAGVAEKLPVFSFASGPTNSMRGAALLSGLTDAIVVDVGGTTTDVGCLTNGFPREANNVVTIGGVRTLFRMPDLLSIALGGGTIVSFDGPVIGPKSVGFRLTEEALVFGGDTVTATDIAVAAGLASIGDPKTLSSLKGDEVQTCRAMIGNMVYEAVDRMKIDAADQPLLAVGGGAFLVPNRLPGVSEVIHVEHQAVANAVGAAMAQVSGEVDQVFSGVTRQEAIQQATHLAVFRAVEAGASETSIEVVDTEDLPLAYLPGDSRRVRVRVVGDTTDG